MQARPATTDDTAQAADALRALRVRAPGYSEARLTNSRTAHRQSKHADIGG